MNTHFLFKKDLSLPDFEELKAQGVFQKEDIDIAHKEGFVEGFEEGQRQAFDDIKARTVTALSTLQHSLSTIAATEEREQTLHHTITISQALIKTLFPRFMNEAALIEVEQAVRNVLSKLTKKSELFIHCHPDLKEHLMENLKETMDQNFSTTMIHFKEESSYGLSDVTMEWDSGVAWRKMDTLMDELNETLLSFYGE